MSRKHLNILHIITGLGTGGAELSLLRLLGELPEQSFHNRVVSLTSYGTIGAQIESLGVKVDVLSMSGRCPTPCALFALRAIAQRFAPDLIQGWMYHANLISLALAWSVRPRVPLIWNIRHSLSDPGLEKLTTRLTIDLGARCSARAASIIYNAETSAEQHEAFGFDSTKRVVIPNGIDTEQYLPNPGAGRQVRERLGIGPERRLVGAIARYHPMKRHDVLLQAASKVVKRFEDVVFVLVGKDLVDDNEILNALVSELGLHGRIHLLGERHDVPQLLAAMDIFVSSSGWGEGFPNVVAEAMACEVPCIVTNVGDSADLVDDTGIVVEPNDPQELAQGCLRLLGECDARRRERGRAARRRIVDKFNLAHMAERYAVLYESTEEARAH
jgi:glycosyltransferase involved in cell wall biosynthesis